MTHVRSLLSCGLAFSGLVMSGCTKLDRIEEHPVIMGPPLRLVFITPAAATMRLGDSVRFVISTTPPVTPPPTWIWTSTDTARIRVDSTGLARAIGNPTPGMAICATMSTDVGMKGCATVVIQAR